MTARYGKKRTCTVCYMTRICAQTVPWFSLVTSSLGTKVRQCMHPTAPAMRLSIEVMLDVVRPPGFFCLAYTLTERVMTPIFNPQTNKEYFFNFKQSAARRCVEQVGGDPRPTLLLALLVSAAPMMPPRILFSCFQTFGILKKQWRDLDMKSERHVRRKVIDCWACLVMHNMMVRYMWDLRVRGSSVVSRCAWCV
jgi:hypothetical protein